MGGHGGATHAAATAHGRDGRPGCSACRGKCHRSRIRTGAAVPRPGSRVSCDVGGMGSLRIPGCHRLERPVAIVDACGDPAVASDLATYRSQYGLPPCTAVNGCFAKLDQRGRTSFPRFDAQWALEISLDVDMVSAICSGCRIVLIEAKSNSFTDLFKAIDEAYAQNADAISNSWGTDEFSGEPGYDGHFTKVNGAGRSVVITASSGDSGYPHRWYPAASPHVNAIGRTQLAFDPRHRLERGGLGRHGPRLQPLRATAELAGIGRDADIRVFPPCRRRRRLRRCRPLCVRQRGLPGAIGMVRGQRHQHRITGDRGGLCTGRQRIHGG